MPRRLMYPAILGALAVAIAMPAAALDYTSRAVVVNPTTGAVTLADGSVLYPANTAMSVRVGERVTVLYGSPDPLNLEIKRFYP